MNVYLGKQRLRLDEKNLLREGGEGRVYRSGDLAVKIFTTPTPSREAKLRAYPRGLPPGVVGPLDLCTDARGGVVGFTMRVLEGAADVQRLGQGKWREGRVDNAQVLAVFRELTATVTALHRMGIVVGDLNDGNVVVTTSPSCTPWLIDADSMQFGGHPCVVAHERTLDPRLYGVDLGGRLSTESDWYALAVLLFSSLLYVHPFGGAHPSHPTLLRRAEARCSALRTDVKLPGKVRVDMLSDDALAWFERVFEDDLRVPPPATVLAARFTRCSCGVEHARSVCPACTTRVHVQPAVRTLGKLRATRVFLAPGRIVAATGAAYAWEDDATLRREDGAVVLQRGETSDPFTEAYFRDPNRIVRLAGLATWIFAAGRWTKFHGGTTASVAAPYGDAGPNGLIRVDGDVLVREDVTRLGSVLEGQTRVRVGATMGFAFYRAGGLTVAFVFDPRAGALRQVEGFPSLRGRLTGWSAVFDDAHALVSFATETNGRTEIMVHLVDRFGAVVATERSTDPAATALAKGLGGRALSGGSVVAATDEGLVLVRADRGARTFVPVRLFPEAKDFASPEDELVPGPGGSLHVIAHDEITHLCFH